VDDTTRLRRHFERGLVAVVAALSGVLTRRKPVQGLAVLGLAFYGAWLIYEPAGYLTAAALLLLDLATERPT
jgi:hypothetical protein